METSQQCNTGDLSYRLAEMARGSLLSTNYWLLIYCLAVGLHSAFSSQELTGFDKDTDVDFEKGDVLAEIHFSPTQTQKTTTKTVRSTTTENSATKSATEEEDGWKLGRLQETTGSKTTTKTSSMTTTIEATTTMTTTKTTTKMAALEKSLLSNSNEDAKDDMPPHITWPVSQERVIVIDGGRGGYSMQCQADGNPSPVYKWNRDDLPLDENGVYIKGFRNGTLYFSAFTDREDGLYQCTAENVYGKSVSVKVPIVSERLPERAQEESDRREVFNVREREPMSLRCAKTPTTVPEYIKRWYQYRITQEIVMDERVGTDSEGTLRFAFVIEADSMEYICGLVPRLAEPRLPIRLYNVVDLKVSSQSHTGVSAPKEAFISKDVKAVIGRNVTLDCFFSGLPAPKITWRNSTKDEITTSNQRFVVHDFGRKMTIYNVQQEDEGVFTCTAKNLDTREAFISVNVTTPPLNLPHMGLTTLTMPDHHDVTLNCKARAAVGESLDTPVWYRNGKLLNRVNLPDPSRYRFSDDLTSLHITDLDKTKDTANYQCNVSNSEGYLFFDGFLRVINAIEITRRPEEFYVVKPGDVIDITVHSKGDSCCEIRKHWYLNDVLIPLSALENPPFVMHPDGHSIHFNVSSVPLGELGSYLGKYKCRVSNKYQAVDVEFVVSDKDGDKENVAAADTGSSLWWIGLICGLVVALIIAIAVVIFIKTYYPGDTYQLEKTELKHNLNPEEDLLNQSFQEI